jgi:hypothetical protein
VGSIFHSGRRLMISRSTSRNRASMSTLPAYFPRSPPPAAPFMITGAL